MLLRTLALVGVLLAATAAIAVCAVPAASAPRAVPHVLVYDQTLGFHHQSVEKAEVVLRQIAAGPASTS